MRIIEPYFTIGSVVRHTLHQYRAVVVDVDASYQKDADFLRVVYQDTPPDIAQPWYTVLVDEGEELSYLPESMLQSDTQTTPINHPLTRRYLTASIDGAYKTKNAIS